MTKPKRYTLKCLPRDFDAIKHDMKRFELTKDREYQTGDYITLLKWDGRESMHDQFEVYVTYTTTYLMPAGYVALGIAPVYKEKRHSL